MKKELNSLYNQLKKAGLNSYASKVAAIYKKAGEFEDMMAKEMGHSNEAEPKPTLAPIEEPDMDQPVFNSENRKEGGECEEVANALLPLLGTENDMDKFYPAAVNFINTIKKLYNHPELDNLRYALKINVKNRYNLFDTNFIDGYDENGNPIPLRLRKNWVTLSEATSAFLFNFEGIIQHAAAESYGNIINHIAGLLLGEFNASVECVKSICSTILDASPKEEREKNLYMRSLNEHIQYVLKKD